MKKTITLSIIVAIIFTISSCKKKENEQKYHIEFSENPVIKDNEVKDFIKQYLKRTEKLGNGYVPAIFANQEGFVSFILSSVNCKKLIYDYPPIGYMTVSGKKILIFSPISSFCNRDDELIEYVLKDYNLTAQKPDFNIPTWAVVTKDTFAEDRNKSEYWKKHTLDTLYSIENIYKDFPEK